SGIAQPPQRWIRTNRRAGDCGDPCHDRDARSRDVEEVRVMSEIEDPSSIEVLYWVGCAAAVDPRLQKIARALVRVMARAGVRFAVLGPEERCTGDVARRTGNEFHFRMLAEENIRTLDRYRVKRIVTHCPHCAHTLRNEYPALGGQYDVVH